MIESLAAFSPQALGEFKSWLEPWFLNTGGSGSSSITGMLTGQVAANGTIVGGSGFTITKGATGIYAINFDVAYAVPPDVQLTTVIDSINVTGNGTGNLTVSKAGVVCRNLGGSLTDADFHFWIIPVS